MNSIELNDHEKDLALKGQTIRAIRALRDRTAGSPPLGSGLMEAKDAVVAFMGSSGAFQLQEQLSVVRAENLRLERLLQDKNAEIETFKYVLTQFVQEMKR